MFARENYHPETPKAVIDILRAGFDIDSFDGEDGDCEWGDDIADAVSAAATYAYNTERHDQNLQDRVAEAVAAWNDEGDSDATVAALDEAFRLI